MLQHHDIKSSEGNRKGITTYIKTKEEVGMQLIFTSFLGERKVLGKMKYGSSGFSACSSPGYLSANPIMRVPHLFNTYVVEINNILEDYIG